MQKWSFNVHGYNVADKAALYAWILKNKPQTMTVLDNKDMASEIADLGVPYVILRITPNDDELHLKISSFASWWKIVKDNYTDKRLGVYFVNEPHPHLEKLAQLCIEGMDILAAEGHWGVFGNFSVGTPEFEDWSGVLRPMMQYLTGKYSNIMFLGLHEGYMYEPEYAIPYLSGRYRYLFSLYGRGTLSILFTEFGVDWIEDVAKRYPGESIRGWKQHTEYWKKQGHSNPQQYMLDHFKYLQDNLYIDPEVKGINLFSYGDSGGWDLYDFSQALYFMANTGQLEMETVIPVSTPMIIKSNDSLGTNRRTGAGTNFSKSKIMLTTPVEVTILETSGLWTKYRFSDGDFWVHNDFVTIVTQGKDVQITLYNASDEEIAEITALIPAMKRLADLFTKLQVEIS